MQSETFWVQTPVIHATKVLFAKGKFPDGIILPPVATATNPNTSRPSAKTTIPLAKAHPRL
jgi:hypothetical protein